MVQKIHPRGVIWVPSSRPHAGHLSEKNDNLAVQYEDVYELANIVLSLINTSSSNPCCVNSFKFDSKILKLFPFS